MMGSWNSCTSFSGPADKLQTREFRSVIAAVKVLHKKSADGQSIIGKDYFADPELLGAHLLYDWVLHYQQGLSILGELPQGAWMCAAVPRRLPLPHCALARRKSLPRTKVRQRCRSAPKCAAVMGWR